MKKIAAVLLTAVTCTVSMMPYEVYGADTTAVSSDGMTNEDPEGVSAGIEEEAVEEGTADISGISATETEDALVENTEETGVSTSGDKSTEAVAESMIEETEVKTYLKSTTKINVKWAEVEDATGYTIYKSKDEDGTYTKVKTVGDSKNSYLCTGLSKGTRYYFKVESRKKISSTKLYTAMSDTATRKTPSRLTRNSTGYSTTYAAKAVKKGASKVGKPYVYGASGPNSFDCSGFVYWTLKNCGVDDVSISRKSSQGIYNKYKKYNVGKTLSKAQPGDIILFSKNKKTSNIYHASIYYGNSKHVHATTGSYDGVEIDSLPTSQIAAIIRMPGFK